MGGYSPTWRALCGGQDVGRQGLKCHQTARVCAWRAQRGGVGSGRGIASLGWWESWRAGRMPAMTTPALGQLWPRIREEFSGAPLRTTYYILAMAAILAGAAFGLMKVAWFGKSFVLGFVFPVSFALLVLSNVAISAWRTENMTTLAVDVLTGLVIGVGNAFCTLLVIVFRSSFDELLSLIPESSAKTAYMLTHKPVSASDWASLVIYSTATLAFVGVLVLRALRDRRKLNELRIRLNVLQETAQLVAKDGQTKQLAAED
jgi:hypothetical protein